MEVKIDTEFLLKNNLTPNEAVVLYLIHAKKNKEIRRIIEESMQNPFEFELERLKKLEYIEGNTVLSYKLTDKGRDTVEARDFFQELVDAFPQSVVRKDGKKSYLRTGKKRSKELYTQITRKRRDIHEHILECLKYEIEQRTISNELMWFKTLPKWLEAEEWEVWGERMKDDAREAVLGEIDTTDYGGELE